MLARYGDECRAALPMPQIGEDDREVLRAYFEQSLNAAVQYVGKRGSILLSGKNSRSDEVVALSLALPLLHQPDRKWTYQQVQMLPEWMRSPKGLEMLERVSMLLKRPYTAFKIGQLRANVPEEKVTSTAFLTFAQTTANTCTRSKQYATAAACWRAAAEQAAEMGLADQAADFRFNLAQLLADTGHAAEAAKETQDMLAGSLADAPYGRAAMLDLVYLYKADANDVVLKDYFKREKDPRVTPYRPQMLYVAWVASRKQGDERIEEKLRKEFLDQYGSHSLAADMYFAVAMQALAAANYREARTILDFIEAKFPDSHIIRQAKQIKDRLDQMDKPSAGSAGSVTDNKAKPPTGR